MADNKEAEYLESLEALMEGDRLPYMTKYLKITDKRRRVIPYAPNNVQRDYFQSAIDDQLKDSGKVRLVVLKARRMGCSTTASANIFSDTATRKRTTSYIISHEVDSAKAIYEMYQTMYAHLPDALKPAIKKSNARELLFAEPAKKNLGKGLHSSLHVQTAKNSNIGKGSAIHHIHGSEVAFWPEAKAVDLMTSVEQTVPDLPGTTIIYESTANQSGGAFYDRYWSAKEGASEWRAVFVPWFAMDEYQMPLEEDEELDMSAEEFNLQMDFDLTDEQIKWRRWMILNKCGGDVSAFRREYPSTDEEAFMFSRGEKVFNTELSVFIRDAARQAHPVWRGEVREGNLIERGGGRLRIWAQPTYGRKYVIGVDPSEGLGEGCEQAIQVIDATTLEQAAEWGGMVDLRLALPMVINAIGLYYSKALVAVEANNHGHAVLHGLLDLNYPNLYRREKVENRGEPPKKVPGWNTDKVNRQLIIDLLDSLIKDGVMLGLIKSEALAQEIINFCYDDNGKAVPPKGKYADRLMAYMIGNYITFNKFGHTRQLKKRLDSHIINNPLTPPAHESAEPSMREIKERAQLVMRNQQQADSMKKVTLAPSPLVFSR